MKRTLLIAGLSLILSATLAFAQGMDSASEKAVQITQGPNVTNITGNSATMNWTTNSPGANHVKYRVAGSNSAWKSAYHTGGGTNHSLQLTGLQPGQTYEWQILTRDGDVRTSGQFQSAATATGTAPDVNAAGAPPAAGAAPGTPATPASAHVPVYRLDNSRTGGHLYTTTNSVSAPGFSPVGVSYYVASGQDSGTIPLYHLVGARGDNFYTTNADERNAVMGQGYQDQGVLGYVATTQVPGTQPLHRMYNGSNGQHFYTASPTDVTQATQNGYKDEGIAGYVWTQP